MKKYHGTGKLLIMDDEELVRKLLVEILKGMGFSVVATQDGEAAFDAFITARNQGDPFRAAILDLTIPGGLGGKDTVQRIRKIDQKIPVFVVSGYSEDTLAVAEPESFGFTASIGKPFLISQLSQMFATYL